MVVQEIRWDKGGTVTAGDYNFFYAKWYENHQLGTGCFVRHRILSAVKRVEFVSDRVSYLFLRGACIKWGEKWWFKRQFLWGIRAGLFYHFSKYHIKILLGDFNAKLGRENIFKPTNGNESLHQDSNDNCIRIVKSQHQKIYLYMLKVVNNTTRYRKNVYSRY